MKILMYIIAGLLCSQLTFGFELHGTAHHLTADDDTQSTWIAIKKDTHPFEVQSLPHLCQGNIVIDGLATVGRVSDGDQMVSVFHGTHDIHFTLHAQIDGQDHPITTPTITRQKGQTAQLKARFYRQNRPLTITTHTINKHLSLTNGTDPQTMSLNVHLNFAKPATSKSCRLLSNHTQTIILAPILAQQLDKSQRVKGDSLAKFAFQCDDNNAKIHALIYDHNNPNHFGSTILQPSADSTAKGVGIELYHNNTPITLHAKPVGTPSSFDDYLQMSTHHLTLGAGYVKTGAISSGKIKATAGLVFFYP